MYLFFDTETTGLPRNWKLPLTDFDNWPRMVQIAWLTYDNNGQLLKSKDFIIIPEDFLIPKEASLIHGITTERAYKEGYELKFVLELFEEQIKLSDTIIAHNMNFDEKIIGAEFLRKQIISNIFQKSRICTMMESINYCKIDGMYGYKWPKLSELYIKLFGVDFKEAHNAFVDINATAKCFWKMKELGVL
jgi:DNA polymerase III epsilon subunit-like protein